MCQAFQKRLDLVAAGLRALPGIRIPEIGGAFYAFFDISSHLGTSYGGKPVATSVEWCEALLEAEQVATVAGSAFGAEGHVRMSFAASEAKLTDGLARIGRFLSTAAG